MKKLLVILVALFMLCGCSKTPKEDNTLQDDTNNDPVGWVYEGPGYQALYDNLGKADVDLSNADGNLKAILDKGSIVLATSPDYPPMEFPDEKTGEVLGADILLAKYIANSLGVNLVVEGMEFGAVLTSLDTGKADIAISGFGYKEDRAVSYELTHGFSTGTSSSHHTILVPSNKLDDYNSLSDFAGKTVYAQVNSLQQMYVEDQLVPLGAKMELVSDISEALLGMAAGKADAAAFDSTTALNYANTSDGMFVSLFVEKGIEFDLSMYADYDGYVAAIKKGETSLLNAVNTIIDQCVKEGLYQEMYYAACDACGIDPTAEEE